MKKNQDPPADALRAVGPTGRSAAELRRRAEEQLKRQESKRGGQATELETARLVHELQVHQVELEMQNEELKTSRAKVEAGLALYADLYDFAPTGYLTLDREGAIRQVNLTGARLLGVERSQLVQRRFGQFVAESDRRAFNDFLEKAFASEVKECCEVTLPREGLLPLAVQIEGTRSADGQECRAIALDITERKAAERHLREQNEILTNSREGVMVVNLANEVSLWNRGAEAIFGWTAAEALGRPPEKVLGVDDLGVMSTLRAAVERDGFWNGELRSQTRDGRQLIVDCRITLVRDEAGRPRAWLSFLADITAEKLLEEKSLHAQRLESIGMLAAGIAHDFNNALAPILMAGSLLRQYVSDPGAQHLLGTVEKSADRSVALVRQLLSFARGASGHSQLLQVRHVLREVIELAEATFPKSIRVESDLPDDLWPVQGSPTQIHQIFLNLCVNARDAMPEGGELTLTAANHTLDVAAAAKIAGARPGAFLTVEVRDTGTGIPPELLAQIWEPFFTTKGEGQGTGLGLSTVRGILHQHAGFVSVQTRAGHGTAFTVYLPATVDGKTDGAAAAPTALPRGHGELILVVDDEELVCELTAQTLIGHGYRAVTACDGADAIAVFVPQAADVRLLLTDLDMPVLGGAALARTLRRLQPGLRIIAMSGAGSAPKAATCEWMSAFLAKPFQPETLLPLIHRVLHEPAPPTAPHPAPLDGAEPVMAADVP